MYVYLKNNRIYHKSEEKRIFPNTTIIESNFNIKDDLIWEDGEIKLYEKSEQYKKDYNITSLEEKNRKLEEENKKLSEISDREIRKELWMIKTEKITAYHRNLYHTIMQKKWLEIKQWLKTGSK